MIGQKFGRLTVLGEGEAIRYPSGSTKRRMLCRCACGIERLVIASDLRRGHSRSCGCMRSETYILARNTRTIVDGFLGWTTEFLNFIPVGDTYALVDESDFPELSRINWQLKKGGDLYYARCAIKSGGKWATIGMHQLILPLPKGFEVDHGNRNGLDNRKVDMI